MNIFKKKQEVDIKKVEGIGKEHLYYFQEACIKASDKESIHINKINVILQTFVNSDIKQKDKLKSSSEKKAFGEIAKWKGNLLIACSKQYGRYAEQKKTELIPNRIIKGVVHLVKEEI